MTIQLPPAPAAPPASIPRAMPIRQAVPCLAEIIAATGRARFFTRLRKGEKHATIRACFASELLEAKASADLLRRMAAAGWFVDEYSAVCIKINTQQP